VPAREEQSPDAKAPAPNDGAGHRDASRGEAPHTYFVNFACATSVEQGVTREATRRIGRPVTRSRARRTA
jgi:hypothetical protein